MTLHETIGRLFFVGIPGPELDDTTRQTLEQLQVGGVILFRRNAGTPDAIAALAAELHALPSKPLVAIDHEGGRVMRLGAPFTHFPPAAVIGRSGDPRLAYRVGLAMAKELCTVGIDLNFAPVLDVHSNPANPVIGDRSFGEDPSLVANMGIAMVQGIVDGGLIPCGKHFPGHGDTEHDSHFELPVVRRSRRALEDVELVPFRAAIAAQIPMLMSAHVMYPALDAERPATLSHSILTALLRGEMGFEGVLASDDLEMRAITTHQSIGAAAIAALRAGVDALLVCEDLAQTVSAAAAVYDAVTDGALDQNIITAAAQRIDRLRELNFTRRGTVCDLPSAEHQGLVEELERRRGRNENGVGGVD